MGFKMKGWKAFTTKDHSNNKSDGRAGSSAFQQKEGFEAYKPGAVEGASEAITQKAKNKAKDKFKNIAKDKYIRQSPHPRDESRTKSPAERAKGKRSKGGAIIDYNLQQKEKMAEGVGKSPMKQSSDAKAQAIKDRPDKAFDRKIRKDISSKRGRRIEDNLRTRSGPKKGKRSKGGAILDSPMKQGVKRPYPPNATDKRKEAQDKREKEKTKELIERKKRWEPNPSERWDPTPRPKTKRIPQDSPMKQGYSDPDSGIKGKYETFRQWRDHIADSINVGARKGDQYKKRMKREAEKKQRIADAKDIKAKAPGIGGRKV